MLNIGSKLTDFSIKDQNGNNVRFSDYYGKNKIVLVLYPGDDTPGCTKQLCAIRDDWSQFLESNAVVFGVNHADENSHKKFINKYNFPFPILIDSDRKLINEFGAIKKFFKATITKRTVVITNLDGVITYIKSGMPDNKELLEHLSSN